MNFFKRILILLAIQFLFVIPTISQGQIVQSTMHNVSNQSVEDFLLDQLIKYKILVIPECLSHDSYDAIQLPIRIIKRWKETNNSHKLFIGKEDDELNTNIELIRNNSYNEAKRFATICPGEWGLFSTRRLNEYLFYNEIKSQNADNFKVFGFENSFHYYDNELEKYVLPSQIVESSGNLKKIPFLESNASMVIKYAYSRFFRDYLSFKSIALEIENNPDALFIIIVGNAHTLKNWTFDETDEQILAAYAIDTTKYAHTLSSYLNDRYNPLFIQSKIDSLSKATALLKRGDSRIDTKSYTSFFFDYLYLIPETVNVNLEEPPLLSIPSASNLSLLEDKNFQYYPNKEFEMVAQKLIYLFTGIIPEIIEDSPGQVGSCTFINPDTKKTIDLNLYQDSIINWYKDGTFIRRIAESPFDYNHRSLFKGIFRSMGKDNFQTFTDPEQIEFLTYVYAALSVIGNEAEKEFAMENLQRKFGPSDDYYYYFKKMYGLQYR